MLHFKVVNTSLRYPGGREPVTMLVIFKDPSLAEKSHHALVDTTLNTLQIYNSRNKLIFKGPAYGDSLDVHAIWEEKRLYADAV